MLGSDWLKGRMIDVGMGFGVTTNVKVKPMALGVVNLLKGHREIK